MKLWQKSKSDQTAKIIEDFTIGRDQEMDLHLAKFDLLGNMAHAIMLESVGLLEKQERDKLLVLCKDIYHSQISKNNFIIEEGIEDVHSQIEFILTKNLGDIGKKIHSGRSRNDQVLVDLKMYLRNEIKLITNLIDDLANSLIKKSNEYKKTLLPGYTHLQIAMPSSFGLWFGAYAEGLIDDLEIFSSIYKVVNKNPLGSGAGYGSSFPLNRQYTSELLGFDDLDYNVVYAQMTRGKSESLMASGISNVANTLSKLAMDVCLYNSQNFDFIELPVALTTGSSIMPHKKNPDVAEILRGKFNLLKNLPMQINGLMSNLPSGYHREYQLLKEIIIPAIEEFKNCLLICDYMISHMKVKENLLEDSKYDMLFSVENVNALVNKGVPFREAYQQVGQQINEGTFTPLRELYHTLDGSIGNLNNDILTTRLENIYTKFNFEKVDKAFENLLSFGE